MFSLFPRSLCSSLPSISPLSLLPAASFASRSLWKARVRIEKARRARLKNKLEKQSEPATAEDQNAGQKSQKPVESDERQSQPEIQRHAQPQPQSHSRASESSRVRVDRFSASRSSQSLITSLMHPANATAQADQVQHSNVTDLAAAAIERRAFYKSVVRPLRYLCRSVPVDSHPPVELTRGLEAMLFKRRYKWLGDQPVIKRDNYPLWHLANRSITEFLIARRVMMEACKRLPELGQSSGMAVLDFGAATGVNLWALLSLLKRDQISSYLAVESSPGLSELARELHSYLGPEVLEQINFLHRTKLPEDDQQFDLIILSSSLILHGQDRRRELLKTLWSRLKSGGAIVFIEDGTEEGFKVVRYARQSLLDNFGERRLAIQDPSLYARVVAPCGHDGLCPMNRPGDVCRFSHRILYSSLPNGSPIRKRYSKAATTHAAPSTGGIVFQDYSYVILTKGDIQTPPEAVTVDRETMFGKGGDTFKLPPPPSRRAKSSTGRASEEADEAEDDELFDEDDEWAEEERMDEQELDQQEDEFEAILPPGGVAVPPSLFTQRYSRLITPPLRRGRHVIIDVCGTDGKLKRWVVPKSAGLEGGYAFTKKLKWGDLMPFEFTQRKRASEAEHDADEEVDGDDDDEMNEVERQRKYKSEEEIDREKVNKRLVALNRAVPLQQKRSDRPKAEKFKFGMSDGLNAHEALQSAMEDLKNLEQEKKNFDEAEKERKADENAAKMVSLQRSKALQGEALHNEELEEAMEEMFESQRTQEKPNMFNNKISKTNKKKSNK